LLNEDYRFLATAVTATTWFTCLFGHAHVILKTDVITRKEEIGNEGT
jgi:hypothetical protein